MDAATATTTTTQTSTSPPPNQTTKNTKQPVAILAKGNHDPSMPPGRLIVLNLFYMAFIGYVMLFALSQVTKGFG